MPVDIVEEFHIKSMMAYSNSSKNDITAPDLLIIKDADHYQVLLLLLLLLIYS